LILVFAGLGMTFVGAVYRYLLVYVYDSSLDTLGLLYPRALMQLMSGLYVAEICLIGLFALKTAVGPMLLMIIFLIFTLLVNLSLNEAVEPLLNNLPRDLALESDIGPIAPSDPIGVAPTTQPLPDDGGGLAADYYDADEQFGDDPEPPPPAAFDSDARLRGVEGASSSKYTIQEWTKAALKKQVQQELASDESGLTRILAQIKEWLTPDPAQPRAPNFVMHWLHPEVYQDVRRLQPRVNPGPGDYELPDDYVRRAYWPPEMWTPTPRLWIPRDEARVSRQEVAHTREAIGISDRGCWLDGKGRVVVEYEEAPLREERVLY